MFATPFCECFGLRIGPSVAGMAASPRHCPPFDGNETSTRAEGSACLSESGIDVGPVMHGRDRPHDRRGRVRHGQCLGRPFDVAHVAGSSGEQPRDPQHHRRGIDTGHVCTEVGGMTRGDAGTAADVHHDVAGPETAQPCHQTRVAFAAHDHAERGDEPVQTGEPGMVCMVVGGGGVFDHALTLTVEPNFKSSGDVPESLLTIGEVARRARVTTSTIRYYERRGLLAADARTSGQRRYRDATLRRLVFIGMLQDAGLALDDIEGVLDAADVHEWKAIAGRRLEVLDAEIARLTRARAYLSGALFCRFDHPATDCKIMGAEIDRRLDEQEHPTATTSARDRQGLIPK